MALTDSLKIAAAGLKVQGERLNVIAENIANSQSTSTTPGGDPYRRKTVTFSNALDKELGIRTVAITKRGVDPSAFNTKYNPAHPAADAEGYVKYPNVSSIVEGTDLKEARRAYEANINVIEISKSMLTQTLQLLKQ
jgi:flagellar basal-body rod protein FlgC